VPREPQETAPPTSPITKLGFVRFSLPQDPALVRDTQRIRITELPSFSIEESERPRVQMEPLIGRRRAWTENGRDVEQASDAGARPRRPRSPTLVGVEPFPGRPRGSSPIAVVTGEITSDAEPAPAARDGAPTAVDLAPLGLGGALAGVARASAPAPAADPLVLLQRLRTISTPPASQVERAALRRLRPLTQPRGSGSAVFDTIGDGAEIVVGMHPAGARWRVAVVGAVVVVVGAAAGLAVGLAALL